MNLLHSKFLFPERIRKGVFLLSFLFLSNYCVAATYYLVGSGGNWSDVTQWSTVACGGAAQVAGAGIYYPGQNAAGDVVVICDNKSVTLDVSPANAIASLTMQATANNTTLTLGAGQTLTVTGAVTQTGPTTTGKTNLLAVGTATLICSSVSMPNLTNGGTYVSEITLGTTGVITCSGNFASAGAANEDLIVVTGNGLIQIGGNFTGNAALTAGTGTVELYSATVATTDDYAFYNLKISGGTKSGTTTNTVSHNLDITGGTWNPGSVNFTVNGATTISGSGAYADNNNGGVNTFVGLVTLSGTGTWTSTAETSALGAGLIFQGGIRNNSTASPSFQAGAASFTANQTIDGSGAMSFTTSEYINGAFTVTNQNTNTVTMTGALDGTVAGSTWKNDNGSTLNYGSATVPFATAGVLDAATCTNTVNYNLNGAQNVKGTTYCNLTLSTVAASTKTLLTSDAIVNGIFTLNALVTFQPAALNFTANGNCSIYGTFADNSTTGTSILGDAAADNIDLSGGTINGSATGIMTINGTIQPLTANATIGRFTVTVVTPVTINSPYTITFNSNTGIKTFQGLVTVNSGGTWTSTTITTTGNLIFQNGLTNNGTFTAGTATFNTSNQIISGGGVLSFASAVQISGAFTVTNQNTNTVTITGALDGTVAGSTWKNDAGSTLNYGNAAVPFATAGVLDAATCTNTVNYNLNGAQNVYGTTYCNLMLSTVAASTKTLLGATIVTGNFTLNSLVTIDPAAQNFTANGNCYIYGTFGDSNTGGTSILGDAAGDLIDLSGGTINGSATGIMTINGTIQPLTANATIGRFTVTVVTPVTITSPYTITFNSNTGIKTFQDLVTINNGATWTSTLISTTGNLIFQNGLINNGTFTAGTTTFNTRNQLITGAAAMSFANAVQISGAFTVTNQNTTTVSIAGTLDGTVAGSTWLNDNGSTLNYGSATVPFLTAGVLNAATCTNTINYNRNGAQNVKGTTYCNLTMSTVAASTKTLLGATIVSGNFTLNSSVTIDPVAQNFTANGNCSIYGTFGDSNVGGTSILGDAAGDNIDLSGGTINGTATGVMTINGTIQLLTGSATIGRFTLTVVTPVTITSPYTITFNSNTGIKTFQDLVTINSGATWSSTTISTTGNLIFQNGLTNNGAFSAGTATFNTRNQIVGGSGALSFANAVQISGAFTVTSQNTSTVSITGTLDGTVAGSTWKNDNGSTLNYGNTAVPFATAGVLNAATNSNTVNYNLNGAQSVNGTTYYHLILSTVGLGTKTLVTANAIVNGNFTINNMVVFDPVALNFTANGNCYIYGTFGDGGVAGTSILGDAASDNIDLSGGTINGAATGVITVNGTIQLLTGSATIGRVTITVVTPVTITSPYTIIFNNDMGIKTFQGLVTVNSGGTWTSTAIVTTGNLILQGGLINNGTFSAGTLRFNSANQIIGGSSAISFSNPVHINGAFTITNQNTSTVTITGTLDGTVAGSIWKNDNGSTLNYESATVPFATAGTLDVSTAINTVNYSGPGTAQTIVVPSTGYYHLIIDSPADITKTLGGTIDVKGNITISNRTIFDASTFNINLSGNWINNSARVNPFTSTGTVSFIGTSSQLINGSASTTFYNLTLNNTGASGNDLITMSIPNTVSNTLTLTDGLLVTDAVNVITLTNPSASATTAGNKTGPSFVRGPISWIGLNGAGPFVFPAGDGDTKWAPVALSNVSPATDFTCQYFKASYSNVSSADLSSIVTPTLTQVSKIEYWDVHRNSAAGSAAVTLYWDSASASGINSCAADGPLKVAHYNSSAWENANSSGTVPVTGSCSGSSGGTVTSDIMTSFSPFSFGSGGSGVNPLPIELLNFNTTHNGQNVIVTWQTASEINNDYFTIERSIDGINFVVVGTEPSKALNGKSTVTLNYGLEDATATSGTYYYRLKQTDYDGNYKYSNVVVITIESRVDFSFDIAPNPNDGKQISVFWVSQQSSDITITIHDIVGQLIYSQQLTTTNGNTPLPIYFHDELGKGIYFITVTQNGNQSLNKKFVVK